MGKTKEIILDESAAEKRCAIVVRESMHKKFVDYVNAHGGKVTAVVEALLNRCVDDNELNSPLMGEKKGKGI